MTYQFIASRWFTKGPRTCPVRKVVWHTIESPCEIGMALSAADYCRRRPDKVSAHYFVDPATVIQGVLETDIAYCAPGANSDGVHIEQAGRAAFTFADWMAHTAMFQITASLTADICKRHQIPPVFLKAADMVADYGAMGITTHAEVAKAFHLTDHTDPGPNFPIDLVISEVRSLLNLPEEDDMPAKLIRKTSTGAIEVYANGLAAPFHWADPNDAARNVATIGRLAKAGLVEATWIELDDDAFDALPRLVV